LGTTNISPGRCDRAVAEIDAQSPSTRGRPRRCPCANARRSRPGAHDLELVVVQLGDHRGCHAPAAARTSREVDRA
jgi:hypothetical protein